MNEGIICSKNYVANIIRKKLLDNRISSEITWTYLVGKKYQNNHRKLVNLLCGCDETLPEDSNILIEPHLHPTREQKHEKDGWQTVADLVIGWYSMVRGRRFMIRGLGEWICIAESKIFSDIRDATGQDDISQLTKIIDHALLLHDNNKGFPSRVYVTIVTPRYFKERQGKFSKTRLWEKFHQYKDDPGSIASDLRLCDMPFLKHDVETLIDRIKVLRLRWITFERLLNIQNIVEDQIPGKHRITFENWQQIFENADLEQVYSDIINGTIK